MSKEYVAKPRVPDRATLEVEKVREGVYRVRWCERHETEDFRERARITLETLMRMVKEELPKEVERKVEVRESFIRVEFLDPKFSEFTSYMEVRVEPRTREYVLEAQGSTLFAASAMACEFISWVEEPDDAMRAISAVVGAWLSARAARVARVVEC